MTTRKLQGPLGGDYQTDGSGNAVPINTYPLTGEDDVPLRLADHEARVTAAEGRTKTVTTFNPDGSILNTPDSGATVTTTFLADGSIQQVYGEPVNQTWVTSFGADGSVTREQVI